MKYILSLLLFATTSYLQAQTVFSEGKVFYDVFFDDDLGKPQGEFILTVKNAQFKREMKLNAGTSNITISNVKDGETVSYNTINGNKYAQKVTVADITRQNQKFDGAQYQNQSDDMMIAGELTIKYTVTYKDGKSNTVYAAKNVKPFLKEINAMFSYIEGLPLRYEVFSGSKKIILIARQIKTMPIDNTEFLPLKGYSFMEKGDLK